MQFTKEIFMAIASLTQSKLNYSRSVGN